MSYNTDLQSNNSKIQNLINITNALPEAGVGDPILQEKTVSSSKSAQTVTPDAAYDGLSKVTVNAMTTATQTTPSISIDSAGKITASATQTALDLNAKKIYIPEVVGYIKIIASYVEEDIEWS